MPSREVRIVNKLGIHLRAAAAFVGIAQRFSCDVKVSASGQQSNGKSILSVLSLGVPRGSTVLIETKGEREEEALRELTDFVSNRFGEPE